MSKSFFGLVLVFALLSIWTSSADVTAAAGRLTTNTTVYVLAYSFGPGYCSTCPSTYYGCTHPESYWYNHFTVHGLWPQYSTSGYPADCSGPAFDPAVPETIGMSTMTQYWPNVASQPGTSDYDSFWEHEWTKHGTCSGLSQTAYFNATINLIETFGTPSIVSSNVGKSVAAADIRSAFGGSSMVALQCASGSTLTGAYSCWSQTNGIPQKQIVCPSDVQNEDTCTSSTTEILSF